MPKLALSAGMRFDTIAGFTAAAVVLPKAMAYATVAGLPVAVGLYTAFIPMVIYAVLGSSKVLSVSSTTILAILAGTQFGQVLPGGDYGQINANRELIATGAANLGGALFGSMPAGGDASQAAVVRAAGGRSQKSSLVAAGAAAAKMLLLATLLGLLPPAILVAVVIVTSIGLIQLSEFAAIFKIRQMEFRWALVVCLGVLIFGILKGILVSALQMLIEGERLATICTDN